MKKVDALEAKHKDLEKIIIANRGKNNPTPSRPAPVASTTGTARGSEAIGAAPGATLVRRKRRERLTTAENQAEHQDLSANNSSDNVQSDRSENDSVDICDI